MRKVPCAAALATLVLTFIAITPPAIQGAEGLVVQSEQAQLDDPFVGTWRLNLDKSRFPGPPPERPYLLAFEQELDGRVTGIYYELDAEDARTAIGRISYRYDGMDYVDQDVPSGRPAGNTLAFTQVNAHTLAVVHKLDEGRKVYRETRRVSEDGRTMTFVMTASDLQGPVSVVQVFDRQ